MRILSSLLAVLFLVPAGIQAQDVLLEDFESPDTPNFLTVFAGDSLVTAAATWYVTRNSVDLYEDAARAEAVAYDGGQAVDLTGSPDEGSMETWFPTVPGIEYEVHFWYARNNFLGAQAGSTLVEVTGSGIPLSQGIVHDPASVPFSTNLEFRETFTADSTRTRLRFTSRNPGIAGITVDVIRVTALEPTGIADGDAGRSGSLILGVFPNPSRSSVHLEYRLAEPGPVQGTVHDLAGRRVRSLTPTDEAEGTHRLVWDGADDAGSRLRGGIYFLVLRTPEGMSGRKVLLLD